jgi:cytochrome P450
MLTTTANYPEAPEVSMSLRDKRTTIRQYHTAGEIFRETTGPVASTTLAPAWVTAPLVWVTSPAGAHDVLTAPRGTVDKATRVIIEGRRIGGDNLFNLDDQPWQPIRRALQPVFTKHRVRTFGGDMSAAASAFTSSCHGGAVVDLDQACRTVTLDALARTVLGCRLDDHDDLGRDIRIFVTTAADRGVRPINLPYWLPTPTHRRTRAATTRLRARAREIVDRCVDDPDTDAPLVHALLAAPDPETGLPLTAEAITDQLVVFLAAGHDTTATTLAYALWQLGRHPHLQERTRAEALACGNRDLTPDDVKALGYTVQVLHEALRLCPPAPVVGRTAVEDLVVDGYRVPAGTSMIVGIYALHRDPELWERPLRFDPDRFRPEAMKSIDRWQYLPFGGGRRSCIGDHFAMLEATLALATIVRDTEIDSHRDEFPIAVPFTAVAAEPVWATTRSAVGSDS